jgi:hypothetical protein|tara:strand:+ start:523 stop:798 length:276 start_codon:yes stop_codon:yes gene_type:complete
MNLLKSLWNKLVNKTSVSSTLVVVEEECCGDLFAHMCREAGVKQKDIDRTNAVALFEEWYTGPCDEEKITSAMADFKDAHTAVKAKLQGKI